jgi:hypothetical protein
VVRPPYCERHRAQAHTARRESIRPPPGLGSSGHRTGTGASSVRP